MLVFDKNRFGSKREIDEANGYLRVTGCNITKSQIRPYYGKEIPGWRDFGLDADTIYNVYCPEEELKKALESFNNLPLTREHIEVDVENVPKDKIVGSLGDHAEYKRPYVKNNLIVYDKKDIDWILSGKKKELSCGYRYTPVRQSGEFDGKHYDFIMTDIVGNHVALVKEGRAGHDVMVADESPNFTENQIDNTLLDKGEEEMLTQDEFKEADHPRDKDGKFTTAGSGSSTGREVSMAERVSGLKDSLKSQLSKEISGDPKKLRDLAKNDEQLTKLAEVTNMGQGHLKNALNEMADELDGKGSEKKEERVPYEKFKAPLASKIGNWYGPQGEESADKAREMKEMEWTLHKLNTETNEEEKEELKRDLDWEMKKFEEHFGEKPEKYGFKYEKDGAGSEKKEESKESNVSPEVKNHLEKKINGWYENVRHDYEGIDGKFLGVSAEGNNLKIKWEENGKEKTSTISWYKEYTPEQLYDIWMEFGDEGQEAVDSKKMTKDAMSKEDKIGVVMKEFKDGELKSSSGEKVTDPKQAKAIALSEADRMAKDADIPEKAGKPEKAGEEEALTKGENKMAEEVKKDLAEKKVEEAKEEKVVEDACGKAKDAKDAKDEGVDKRKLIDEIGGILKGKLDEELWRTVIKKAEELAYNDSERSADDKKLAKDEDKKDLKGKEKEAFAEGVEYGEKKEKAEPKKLDSEHESEGEKKAEEKKEMAKDEGLTMDVDAIKAQVREEVMADFKAREEARKAVRGFVGDVNVMAFDSAEDIYKFACGKSGMDLNEIVSFKDAFKGLSAGKSKALALDASPVSGSNEECLKDIRIA